MSDIWDRFWSKVAEPFDAHNDCWLWKGAKTGQGYGNFFISRHGGPEGKRETILAHRFAYEQFYEPIGEIRKQGLELHHSCEVRHCVNPNHLQLLSNKDHQFESPRQLNHQAWIIKNFATPEGARRARLAKAIQDELRRTQTQSRNRF